MNQAEPGVKADPAKERPSHEPKPAGGPDASESRTAALGFFEGRGEHKAELVRMFGGSEATEAAVARALRWLAAHQLPDGGWSFDHALATGGRGTGGGAKTRARNAATALALLAFLGAGETYKSGEHRQAVARGLGYLLRSGAGKKEGLSFREEDGNMYSHGMATMALGEALAMTHDRQLAKAAKGAVVYPLYA